FTGGHTYFEFSGFEKDETTGEDVAILTERFAYTQTTVACREAQPGFKIVCDTLYDTYDGKDPLTGAPRPGQRVEGSERAFNCREVDTVCVLTYELHSAKDGSQTDTLVAVLDCNPVPAGKKRVCDSVYEIVRRGASKYSPKDTIFKEVRNCQDVDIACKVFYSCEEVTETGYVMVAKVNCGTPGMKWVCDSVFKIVRRGSSKYSPKDTIFQEDRNCFEVDENEEVTYKYIDVTDSGYTKVPVIGGGDTPPTGKKTVCDTVYTITKGGSIRFPIYDTVGTPENCREVDESCIVTYTYKDISTTGYTAVAKISGCDAGGKKTICDTVYTITKGGSIRFPVYDTVGVAQNCREVDGSCTVTYTYEDVSATGYTAIAKVSNCDEGGDEPVDKKITICDTVYTITKGGSIRFPVYDTVGVAQNCREVSAGCKITYTYEDVTSTGYKAVAKESDCPDPGDSGDGSKPVLKKKTICDTVYTITKGGSIRFPVYDTTSATENCREVNED
ncbi:MAG: hypothetical protein K2H70_05345, partial [Bacteroidales bacterium]|nr:hypothetical protein [Bacteroidales bacterium]